MVNIKKSKNALRFNKPASWWGSTWREALPTGNGVIGASVYGGACDDVIMINHGDLWWQGHVGVMQDVADKLTAVRNKIDENDFLSAEKVLSDALVTKNYRPLMSYPLPLCDFLVHMPIDKSVKDYQRILNMENGEVTVTFRDGATKFERSAFVSRENNLVCYEINKTGSKNIDVTFSLALHDKFNVKTPINSNSKLPESVMSRYENFFMYFSARSDDGTDFGCVARINHFGGTQIVDSNGITIKGAEKVLVLVYTFIESQREKEWKNGKSVLSAVKLTYEKLLKEHTALHSKLFGSADLDLEASGKDDCVEELLDKTFTSGDMPLSLAEKLWAYGRFLMICGASPSSQPCAPYGLWCGDYKAQDSHIDSSGCLQNMYNQVFAGNLCEYVNSIYNYYKNVMDDLKKNASRLFGCRGIMIPSIVARGTGALGSTDSGVINFVAATGWIAGMFYDYYAFTGEATFLKTKAMPFMKDAITFYEEFLKIKDGKYVSSPSYSPESTPSGLTDGTDGVKIARNSTIDFAVVRDLLTKLIKGSAVSGLYKDEVQKWEYMLTCIPEYKLDGDGTVKEYIDDYLSSDPLSPSTCEFYPVFPGTEIGSSDELSKAFLLSARKKYDSAKKNFTAGYLSRYANVFARTGDGDEAYDVISRMVWAMSMQNLILATNDWRGMGIGRCDVWATYSLEGNMGVTNALQEMLLQSTESTISILPARPKAFKKGMIDKFLTRAGVEVCMAWNNKKGTLSVKLKARKATEISLQLPEGASYKPGKTDTYDAEARILSGLKLPANKQISLEMRI